LVWLADQNEATMSSPDLNAPRFSSYPLICAFNLAPAGFPVAGFAEAVLAVAECLQIKVEQKSMRADGRTKRSLVGPTPNASG